MEKDRTEIYKIISKMLDNPNKYGIYPTTTAYNELERYCESVRNETLGWMYTYSCNALDNRSDIRNIEVPKIIKQAMVDLKK